MDTTKTEITPQITPKPSISALAQQLLAEAEAQGVVVGISLRPREAGRWGMVLQLQRRADAERAAVARLGDSALLDWLEQQTGSTVKASRWAKPGTSEYVELEDGDEEVLGGGATLRAAILDAMGVRT